jgi:hypothetical protein
VLWIRITLMRIRIQLIARMRIRNMIFFYAAADPTFHPDADADPDPTFAPDADADPDPTLYFMRIRIQFLLFCTDPDPAKVVI